MIFIYNTIYKRFENPTDFDDYDVSSCIKIMLDEPIKIHELLNKCEYNVSESNTPTFDDNISTKYPLIPKINLCVIDLKTNKEVSADGDDIYDALNNLIMKLY